MLLYSVRKLDKGFTLLEMITVVIIVGVIAAIAAPNFLGLLNRNRVNEAIRQIEGGLKEAQKQAIRSGKQCTVNINANGLSNPMAAGVDGCLLNNRVVNNLVTLNSNRTAIIFSGKGNITIDNATGNPRPVLVAFMANGTDKQSCVVIQNTLGSMRTGEYTGDPSALGNNSSDNCQ
ncbi:MAG: prepilin-type N-terminal cleavage/methylation domain-containing protein [Pleurocapsa sp. MO_226.B13]|nr:prepilin-type N-terminal cleavage/methylation domain-containing protein [Pleurocapsa sp. MO_226.B13]